jgi:hypothetical protein
MVTKSNLSPAPLDKRRQNLVDAIAPASHENTPLALVPGEVLLATLWPDEATRPTLRWLRKMTATRSLPFLKTGNRVWFDVARVRRHLDKKFTVEAFSV